MPDAFTLKDHEHNLVVLVTTTDQSEDPFVVMMDRATGQQVTINIDVFFRVGDAVVATMTALSEGEVADQQETSKLN